MSTLLTKTKIPFVKMHGIGNDFVILDELSTPLPDGFDFPRAAEQFCARHFGIGADGLLLLEPSTRAQIRMRMWNPDGSEDMCGNGLRCIAWLAFARGYVSQKNFQVETLAGIRACEILGHEKIRVEMGAPIFDFNSIPFAPKIAIAPQRKYSLPLGELEIQNCFTLSTGTTHTVIFVDELPDDEKFFSLSPRIENHVWFPERTSVLWTKIESETSARVRIWERGAGETLACGTGACAVGVASQITGRSKTPLLVQSSGGVLDVSWMTNQPIWMTGAARIVYEGVLP